MKARRKSNVRRESARDYLVVRDASPDELDDGWQMAFFEGRRPFEEGLWWTGFLHLAQRFIIKRAAERRAHQLRQIYMDMNLHVDVWVVKEEELEEAP